MGYSSREIKNAGAVDLSRFLVSVARARDAVGGTSALSVLLS